MQATHTIETPLNAVGAVSILRIDAEDLDAIIERLNLPPIETGQIRLASVLGLDDALLARFDRRSILLMPHGGIGITRAISARLIEMGIGLIQPADPMTQHPEAQDIHEARMLSALAIAQSPMAVDVLLGQPAKWRRATDSEGLADARALNRLLVPPVVVALGRANIGKSSLINALADESVAMVSDFAGTTRDHVGVKLDLCGLAVRWVDTPGVDERVLSGEELELVEPVIRAADLIVHAIDSTDANGKLDPRLSGMISPTTPILRLGVRSDIGHSSSAVDCVCSSRRGTGMEDLAGKILNRLIPPQALADSRPWLYWDS